MSIIIVGAGPNLGAAIARRFGREGMPVGLISRNEQKLAGLAESLDVENVAYRPADIRDAEALSGAITSLADELGPVEVLEYSPLPAKEFMKPILETTVDDVRGPLEFSVLGAVAATTAVRARPAPEPSVAGAGQGVVMRPRAARAGSARAPDRACA